jgi:homoserine O-succinyltransferase
MIKVAILDLYEGFPNQGMRCIREIIHQYAAEHKLEISLTEFDVRLKNELPDLGFDVYISSGGPGDPLESEGKEWDTNYFAWLSSVEDWNNNESKEKKHVFFICHSFQMACRYYKVGNVCRRKSTSFGVFPMHMLEDTHSEPILKSFADPFYAVDSRDYQVIEPDHARLRLMGAKILCIEKDRPHVALERAIMGIRFSEFFVGTQFHPEADAQGMSMYLQQDDKKKMVIENHGEAKWESMILQLNDPEKIQFTYNHLLPNFLSNALRLKKAKPVYSNTAAVEC